MSDAPETQENESPVSVDPKTKNSSKKKSNKTIVILISVIAFFFLVLPGLLLLAGANLLKGKFGNEKIAEKTAESILSKATGSNVDIDKNGDNVTVRGENGDTVSVGSGQKLPDSFPKNDIAFLDPKTVEFAMTSSSDEKRNWSVTTTVSKSFDEATKYFEDTIKDPTYSDVATYGTGEAKTYSGNTSKYSVYVTVTQAQKNQGTGVTYIITEL